MTLIKRKKRFCVHIDFYKRELLSEQSTAFYGINAPLLKTDLNKLQNIVIATPLTNVTFMGMLLFTMRQCLIDLTFIKVFLTLQGASF